MINEQDGYNYTALFCDCADEDGKLEDEEEGARIKDSKIAAIVKLLLKAGASPYIIVGRRIPRTPLAYLRNEEPQRFTTIGLLEQAPDADKTSLLVKARLTLTADSTAVAPSSLQDCVAKGLPLPHVELLPLTGRQNEQEEEEGRKFHKMLTFLLGMEGGPKGIGMPRDVFWKVLDLLMPDWDPLRKHDFAKQAPQD